jgi:hypothetical protein
VLVGLVIGAVEQGNGGFGEIALVGDLPFVVCLDEDCDSWRFHHRDFAMAPVPYLRRHAELLLTPRRGKHPAVGAQAPVDDFGLVEQKAFMVRGGQAGRLTDGTVGVCDDPARPADHVMVVIANPRLVASDET